MYQDDIDNKSEHMDNIHFEFLRTLDDSIPRHIHRHYNFSKLLIFYVHDVNGGLKHCQTASLIFKIYCENLPETA